jgi:purine nucleosidase
MTKQIRQLILSGLLALSLSLSSPAQKIKVIVDQDARGPGTSDQQAILVFLQFEKFDVLGITTVSGDQWVKEETQHVLRMLEIAGRTDVPVYQGAEFPYLTRKKRPKDGKLCTASLNTRAGGLIVLLRSARPSTKSRTTHLM